MIAKIYEIEKKVDKLEDAIKRLTSFTNTLAKVMIKNDVLNNPELVKVETKKDYDIPMNN